MALERKGVLQGTFGAPAEQTQTEQDDGNGNVADRQQNGNAKPEERAGTKPERKVDVKPVGTQDADGEIEGEEYGDVVDYDDQAEGKGDVASDEWARTAVEESYRLARRRPKDWGPVPVRLASDAKERLEARRGHDHEVLGINFAETHYVNAALANIPDDLDEALQMVESYLDSLGLKAPTSVGTTGRVLKTTAQKMEQLSRDMRKHAGYGKVGALQTAAVHRLLDALDRLDEGAIDLDDVVQSSV